jgi:hypothetical protein
LYFIRKIKTPGSLPAKEYTYHLNFITSGGILMRLKDLEIDPSTMRLEIDIMEQKGSFAIVVCDGKAKITELPPHGETKIITHQGKVKRVKFDEGEEF